MVPMDTDVVSDSMDASGQSTMGTDVITTDGEASDAGVQINRWAHDGEVRRPSISLQGPHLVSASQHGSNLSLRETSPWTTDAEESDAELLRYLRAGTQDHIALPFGNVVGTPSISAAPYTHDARRHHSHSGPGLMRTMSENDGAIGGQNLTAERVQSWRSEDGVFGIPSTHRPDWGGFGNSPGTNFDSLSGVHGSTRGETRK